MNKISRPFIISRCRHFFLITAVFGLWSYPIRALANCAAPPSTFAQPGKTSQCSKQGKVNLNTASLNELQTLPGIGPSIARRIVDFRAQNPPFQRIEDLLIIPGINRKLLEKIRPCITL